LRFIKSIKYGLPVILKRKGSGKIALDNGLENFGHVWGMVVAEISVSLFGENVRIASNDDIEEHKFAAFRGRSRVGHAC
jgi:hypothetical protein